MALQACLLAFTKDFSKTSTATKGDETTVTANAILLIDEAVVDYFNIPVTTTVSAQVRQTIKTFTYKRYKDFTDTTGVDVIVPAHERGGSASKSVGNVVRLATELKTSRDRPRTCSIRFPSFFNLIMIGQALGTMIKAKTPNTWKLERSGRSYPLVPSTATGLLAGYESGAWVVTTPVTATNADDTSGVGETTVVSGRAKAKASATP